LREFGETERGSDAEGRQVRKGRSKKAKGRRADIKGLLLFLLLTFKSLSC
jgi:hypothetical protein